ncbi:MAG: PD-(D/E)XK nuclease family protein, partial [Candidatus Aenigmarchaeota archaeon]|nr:PD-(D/E)XK nuclease family protein [Candidatus Aenigmarchaeota archaeon]
MNQEQLIEETEEKLVSYKNLYRCPYCVGKIVKRGVRKKKFEEVQIYYCKNCDKRFTSQVTKNKTYPLKIILDSLTLYNQLNSLEEISELIFEKYGIKITPQIVSRWLEEYKNYLPFLRMREFALGKYSKKELVEKSKLIHQQIYNFKFHRVKMNFILNEEFKHFKFKPLRDFLELVSSECPHQIFREKMERASEKKEMFNLDQVKIIPKKSSASTIANLVIQSISNNKMRHEVLEEFMLFNDSVTVAIEVPVILDSEDINHYKFELNFDIPFLINEGEYLTGHIDMIQIRNGSIYIMDFKPSAKKEKPIEQLTIYALALSRLTGIRLYHFKCAWFDSKDYFEFFPLHVVYKLKKGKKFNKNQTKLNIIKKEDVKKMEIK